MRLGPIAAVRVWTYDIDAARAFYGDRLGLVEQWRAEGVVTYDTGQAQLVVETASPHDDEGRGLVGRFVGVSCAVDDVRGVVEQLDASGVVIVGAPELQPWGATLAHVADPDGNVLTLVEYPVAS